MTIKAAKLVIDDFYPRPPRGGRLDGKTVVELDKLFLSTPSARRATGDNKCLIFPQFNFYPRPPRGGRP